MNDKMSFKDWLMKLESEIIKAIDADGIYRANTCNSDCYGWDRNQHDAMAQLARKGIKGVSLRGVYRFEVYEWTGTEA